MGINRQGFKGEFAIGDTESVRNISNKNTGRRLTAVEIDDGKNQNRIG